MESKRNRDEIGNQLRQQEMGLKQNCGLVEQSEEHIASGSVKMA